jgi:hypothetical protein
VENVDYFDELSESQPLKRARSPNFQQPSFSKERKKTSKTLFNFGLTPFYNDKDEKTDPLEISLNLIARSCFNFKFFFRKFRESPTQNDAEFDLYASEQLLKLFEAISADMFNPDLLRSLSDFVKNGIKKSKSAVILLNLIKTQIEAEMN